MRRYKIRKNSLTYQVIAILEALAFILFMSIPSTIGWWLGWL